jgi:hypothetical protein
LFYSTTEFWRRYILAGIRKLAMQTILEWRRQEKAKRDRPLSVLPASPQIIESKTTKDISNETPSHSSYNSKKRSKDKSPAAAAFKLQTTSKSREMSCEKAAEMITLDLKKEDRWNRYEDQSPLSGDSSSEASDVDMSPPKKKSKAPPDRVRRTDPVLMLEKDRSKCTTSKSLGRGKRIETRKIQKRGAVPVSETKTAEEGDSNDECKDGDTDNINNLSQKSCNVIACKFLKVATESNLLLEGHLRPLAKELKLKLRGKDKKWIITDIAKELLKRGRVKISGPLKNITPDRVVLQ